jgi:uncharacterized protein YeaO (DUF488 family)
VSLATRRIYDPATPGEGTRILIMRLWPRGIRKERVDAWFRELGPELGLMRAFRSGRIGWVEYRRRYLAGLERPEALAQLDRIKALIRKGPVTIFCGCPDERRCHRSLLRSLLASRAPARRRPPKPPPGRVGPA